MAAQRVCLARRWVLVRHGSTTAREVVVSRAPETVRHLVTHVGGSVLAAGAPTTMVSSAISRSEQAPRRRAFFRETTPFDNETHGDSFFQSRIGTPRSRTYGDESNQRKD